MTSISASSGAAGYVSPRELLQQQLLRDVSSGTISSGDQDALSAALDSIDASITSSRPSRSSAGRPPSPEDMKSKIGDLIDGQVEGGKLTADQADELKSVFENVFAKGPGGAGGPPPGPPPGDGAGSVASSDETTGTDTSSDLSKLLEELLKAVKSAQSDQYGANGSSTTSATALLLNFEV